MFLWYTTYPAMDLTQSKAVPPVVKMDKRVVRSVGSTKDMVVKGLRARSPIAG